MSHPNSIAEILVALGGTACATPSKSCPCRGGAGGSAGGSARLARLRAALKAGRCYITELLK